MFLCVIVVYQLLKIAYLENSKIPKKFANFCFHKFYQTEKKRKNKTEMVINKKEKESQRKRRYTNKELGKRHEY